MNNQDVKVELNEGGYYSPIKILENDNFNIVGVKDFKEDKSLKLEILHKDKTVDTIELNHTYNKNQIEWFKAGSALNLIAKNG